MDQQFCLIYKAKSVFNLIVKGTEFLPQTQIPYIFATRCRRPFIFPTINSVRLRILSFKYQRFTPSCGKDIEIRKFYFLAKTQFLSEKYCLFVEFDKIILFYLLSGYDPVEEFDW